MAFSGQDTPVLVSFGADYVFTDRDLSPEYIEQLSAEAQKVLDRNKVTSGQVFDYKEFNTRESLATDFGVVAYPVSGYSLVRFSLAISSRPRKWARNESHIRRVRPKHRNTRRVRLYAGN
jgi:hypothetical protein